MKRFLACLAAALVLSGCSALQLESLPAPAGISGPTYHVTATFTDVETLTIGAKVKLGGAVIGEVTGISTRDYLATAGMDIEKRFPLGAGSHFQIRFTTPLGEDYVSVSSPGTAHGTLTDGAKIGVDETNAAPGIEDTFAALSTLLNEGGLGNLQIIARELDTALTGRTGAVRDSLIQIQKVVADLDAHKDDIDNILDELHRMASTINQSSTLVDQALTEFPPTLQLLANDTDQVKLLLAKVGELGTKVQDLLSRSQAEMLAQFADLRPTLDALKARADELIPTFDSLIRFGKLVDKAAPGAYLQVTATFDFLFNVASPDNPSPHGTLGPGSGASAVTTLLTGGLR